MSALQQVIDQLTSRACPLTTPYSIPGLWIDFTTTATVAVDPYAYYAKTLRHIASAPPVPLDASAGGGEWTRQATVYSLFPRFTTAFDHDQNGHLRRDPTADGWRETGSLLKSIALLPYIHNMGFNTIHLLPLQSIGRDGKKGSLGSPYAIRDPYCLDDQLGEPALGLSAEILYAALVEAAHHLGIRVVMEFVLRIAARDCVWIQDHPDWFYWIRADIPDRQGTIQQTGVTRYLNAFGSPHFDGDMMALLQHKVNSGDFSDLPPPSAHYQAMYTQPPRPDQVVLENDRYIGKLDDGTRVRIPGGFSDFPPDDPQPPWVDVTYLRLYQDPAFNYMAYNTLRMYDTRLAQTANINQPLWDAIIGIIPYYQQHFGIDGVLIDMGHALPQTLTEQIVGAARSINPDFAFWNESFAISQQIRDEGYNAVVGHWMLAAHHGDDLRRLLADAATRWLPLTFFAAPENHDTMRAAARLGGTVYSHYALAMSVMTSGVPFLQTGFELGETHPLNTGLGFSAEEIAKYSTATLPLFSEANMNWSRPDHLIKSVKYALDLRRRYAWLLTDPDPNTYLVGYSDNPALVVFSRRKGDTWINVIGNADPLREQRGRAVIDQRRYRINGLWGTGPEGMDIVNEIVGHVTLSPNYVLIVEGGGIR